MADDRSPGRNRTSATSLILKGIDEVKEDVCGLRDIVTQSLSRQAATDMRVATIGEDVEKLNTIVIHGNGHPSLLSDDKEMLEDLVAAAFNDAVRKAEATTQEKMSSITSGLPLPPGMKLPF